MSQPPSASDRPLWPETPELAELYDTECAGRHDHDYYLGVANDVDAETVLDLGCGTGVFSVDVARQGRRSIGVDPALPMLAIAEARAGGELVEWIHGTAAEAGTGSADLVVMMGHVAQYFVSDDEWQATLRHIHRILRPDGYLTFEVRNPRLDWAGQWTKAATAASYIHPRGGVFTAWVEVVERVGSAESYTMTHEGNSLLPDGRHLRSSETLRFRSFDEVRRDLDQVGFTVKRECGDWTGVPIGDGCPELIVLAQR